MTNFREDALNAIYNAFSWLVVHGVTDLEIHRLRDYPVIEAKSARRIFTCLLSLEPLIPERFRITTFNPVNYKSFRDSYGSMGELFTKPQFFGFLYKDKSKTEFTSLFEEKFHAQPSLHIVKSDHVTGGKEGIAEAITNLILTLYFEAEGYIIPCDKGQGLDLIAFNCDFVNDLRAKGLVGHGGTVEQLAALRVPGWSRDESSGTNSKDDIIAVETESTKIKEGLSQLRHGYKTKDLDSRYTQGFDRKVLATPFFRGNV